MSIRIPAGSSGRVAPPLTALLAAALIGGPAPARADCTGIQPASGTGLTAVTVASGLTGRPLFVTAPPGDRDRIFIVEQSGFIRIKHKGQPATQTSLFLDISGRVQAAAIRNEMGLLGLAFDPDHAANGFFYVNYTEGPVNGPWATVISRFSLLGGDPDQADPDSEERLLRYVQPQENHNGGWIAFGPDGFLYISSGDGGGGFDQHGTCGNGQALATMLGKILRIDVRSAAPAGGDPDCDGGLGGYRVPGANPFADGPGGACDEIWSFGLRNPWRASFDPANGDLYIGDVGQRCWEEIDYAAGGVGGVNYGWRQMEGNHCVNLADQLNCAASAQPCGGVPTCGSPLLTPPILEYSLVGPPCAVAGGYVYRGCLLPSLQGRYFFGDNCAGFVKSVRVVGGAATDEQNHTDQVAPGSLLANRLTSFGVDDAGEIYVLDRNGAALKMVPPLTELEVSGPLAAAAFLVGPGAWTWEDLNRVTDHPVSQYRVYRGQPGGAFQCVFGTTGTTWATGDPSVPAPGGMFSYLVAAVNAAGQRTLTGSPTASILPDPCP